MSNNSFNSKLAAVSTVALLAFSIGHSLSASAGMVTYADPVPAGLTYPDCAINDAPTGNDGGISYEWTVKMGKHDDVSFVNSVGAKSYNEPPPAYEPPFTGWTHTSNWVALELMEHTKLFIEIDRQEGVTIPGSTTIATARNKLVPALSIYSGWDNTSCEDHRYNTAGDTDWTTVKYIGNQPNAKGRDKVVYAIELDAGQYSIAIGGSPKVLGTYPAGNCDPADPVCYAYTGRHGYRVEMKTRD